jgi:iron(III) transport system substrate-binding protein
MPNSVAVAATVPHPHAAVLFFDFVMSEAQPILAGRDYVVTNTKVPSPLDRGKIHVMDSAKALREGENWQKLYTQIITSKR